MELGDKRLRDRLIRIAEDRWKKPDVSYLEAAGGDRGAIKGYYYFVDGRRDTVTPEAILATHRERTIERMMARKTVLVIQDTSDLNFSKRPHTTGLGSIGTNQTGAKSLGLKLHSSLVLTTDGLPLGVLRSDCYAPEEKKKSQSSAPRPIEDKQSFRWIEGYRECVEAARHMPQTHIVSVMDREADFYELYQEAEANRKRVGLLIRAKTDRKLVGRKRKLFAELKASPDRADVEVVIPRQRWKKAKSGKPEQEALPGRPASLSVHFQEVTIPATRSDLEGPLTLNAVYAREKSPPRGAKSIEWMLLTTEPVTRAEDAVRIVDLYTMRWRIEEWHRVLKQGCIVQEHQNETAERLQRVIAIDVVLAWRIQLMTLLGREIPQPPVRSVLRRVGGEGPPRPRDREGQARAQAPVHPRRRDHPARPARRLHGAQE